MTACGVGDKVATQVRAVLIFDRLGVARHQRAICNRAQLIDRCWEAEQFRTSPERILGFLEKAVEIEPADAPIDRGLGGGFERSHFASPRGGSEICVMAW